MSSDEEKKGKRRRDDDGDNDVEDDDDTTTPLASGADAAPNGDDGRDEDAPAKRKRKRKRKKKGVADGDDGADGGGAGGSDEGRLAKLGSMEHTVYVEGIPFDCSEDDVKQFFVDNGIDNVIQLRLPKWQDTGRLRGFGHVVFDTTKSRVKAVEELNGLNLGKRYITIKEPNAPRPGTTASAMQPGATGSKPRDQPDGCRIVFVRNLPYEADEAAIHDAFVACGKIVEGGVRLARNYTTRESKGFGYVEFKNPEGAYSAVHRAAKPYGLVVGGRPCFVDFDEGSMKGSFRTGEGKLWNKAHSSGGARQGGRGGGRGGSYMGRGGGRGSGRGGRGGARW